MCEAIEKLANSRAEKVRVEMIRDFLNSGASVEDAVKIFKASSDEIEKAKVLMLQPI